MQAVFAHQLNCYHFEILGWSQQVAKGPLTGAIRQRAESESGGRLPRALQDRAYNISGLETQGAKLADETEIHLKAAATLGHSANDG